MSRPPVVAYAVSFLLLLQKQRDRMLPTHVWSQSYMNVVCY